MSSNLTTKRSALYALAALLSFSAGASSAQTVGALIWEDNFDSLNTEVWNVDTGDGCDIGLCGWGNAELQWYSPDNVSIGAVPGEPGNTALVLEARNQSINGYSFTSGKVTTENKFALQYGMVETRIRVPNVDQGLWPAAWMLGTSTLPWPRKGEIDMMEMGHSLFQRERQGYPGVSTNSYVGANAIFYAEAACVPGNETCAASTAYEVDQNKPYVSSTPMNDRFLIYRTYWTEAQLRFTVEDNGVEYDLYEEPFQITAESNAFNAPFFLLLNLAVGGNFTDAAVPGQVTAPRPAPMYIDYVRVYEIDGQGETFEGNITEGESGVFGVFTENTPTTNALEAGVTSDIFLWDPHSSAGNIAPLEGEYAIAYSYDSAGVWFGGGVQARQARDMTAFADGVLRFSIKIPADVSFRIGVTDTFTNENWLVFPAFENTYGMVRNGEWTEVEIPVSDLRGSLIALQSMQYLFAISSDPADFPDGPFQYAIDDVVWDSGEEPVLDSDGDGVNDDNDDCPGTPAGTDVDSQGCPIVTGGSATVAFGTVSGVQANSSSWSAVSFDAEFAEAPIVVLGAGTSNGGHPFATRVRNISTTGFEYQIDEWDYLDGYHTSETISYIAVAEGTQNWGGLSVSAGEVSVNNNWTTVAVGGLSSAPMVLAQQVSNNESDATTTRLRNVSGTSFQVRLQEQESADQTHANETVHYVAIEAGTGAISGSDVKVGVTSNSVTQNDYTIDFGDTLNNPQFLAGMQTFDGPDTATTRYKQLSNSSVRVNIEEEQSRDSEVNHTSEVVGWVVFGDLETTSVTDSDNDGVIDAEDDCPGTAPGVEVDANGCEVASTELYGARNNGAQSVEFFVNTSAWADVHYIINGGGQQNVRMIQTGSGNVYAVNGLSSGDQVEFFFTYWDTDGSFALDTEMQLYVQ